MTNRPLKPDPGEVDDLYAAIVAMTKGCDEATALKRQARLILLLANRLGDAGIVRDLAVAAVKDGVSS